MSSTRLRALACRDTPLRIAAGAALLVMTVFAPGTGVPAAHGAASTAQIAGRPPARTTIVTFEFTQAIETKGADILILFSSKSGPAPAGKGDLGCGAPASDLRFTFPNQQFARGAVRLTRRVLDDAIRNQRYLRVVNCSSAPWEPSAVSLTVGGRPVLNRVPVSPLKGIAASRGIACTGDKPSSCRYWEGELKLIQR
jgi:hypothetical protein